MESQSERGNRSTHAALNNAQLVSDVLQSWKEIAAFLERDERTAMRWAKDQGMPVRRIPGAKRSRVSASRAEILRWLGTQPGSLAEVAVSAVPRRFTNRHLILAAAICGLGLLVALAIIKFPFRDRLPARVTFTQESVVALDDAGRPLWEHNYHRRLQLSPARRALADLARMADLKGDGDREVLVVAPLYLGPNPQDLWEAEIDCFSSAGKLLWSYAPREMLQFGKDQLRGPWNVFDMLISHRGPRRSIWAVFNHFEWGNAFVVELDPATGRGPVRYVNGGTIHSLNEVENAGVTYLLAAGFNNEHDGGSLAVIDERKRFAASPQTAGTRYQCANCPVGVPDYYFVFPRSELNAIRKEYEQHASGLRIGGDELELWTRESSDYDFTVQSMYLFRLRPSLHPISRRYSSTYDLLHADLERSHQLDHSITACPERLHPPPIRMWTPSGGWQEIAIP